MDPAISLDERLCRIAGQWLDDSQLARTAAATFSAESAADVAEYYIFKLSELAAGGFEVESDARNRPRRVSLGTVTARVGLNLTDEITRLLPEGMPSPYRFGSGAAYARPWLLERTVTETSDGDYAGEGATAFMAAVTVMFCMEAWVTAWGGYFGLDVGSQLVAIDAVLRGYITEA